MVILSTSCAEQTTPTYVSKLSDTSFLNRYDVFFLDVWGTLSDGKSFYPEAIHFLNSVLQAGKRFVFVSNASRLSAESRQGYAQKGLPDYGDHLQVVTAGQTCVDDIANGRYGKKFFIYGKAVSLPEGFSYTENLEEADAVMMAMCNTRAEDGIEPHQDFLNRIKSLNLPVICANADQWVYEGGILYMCSGHIAKHYQNMGGQATLYGKPEIVMFEYAHRLCGLDTLKERILMVGDSFETDIQGAHAYGIDSCVVLTGLYGRTSNYSPEQWMHAQSKEYQDVMPNFWSEKIQ